MKKDEIKLSLFANDMKTHMGNSQQSILDSLLELLRQFSKVAKYKINTQKLILFFMPVINRKI